jgi:hypothetical protein
MRSTPLSLLLSVSLAGAAILAACGGEATPPPQTPPAPTAAPTGASTGDKPADKPGDKPADKPEDKPTDKPASGPAAHGGDKMKSIMASAMAEDLKQAGFDITKLQPMAKMKSADKSKVMKAISKSTGMECKSCHVDGNFKADTPNKLIARHMWDEYVVGMKMADGGNVFCDSCHQGHDDILERKNKDSVSKYMDENYVKKLASKDGKEMGCPTCHTGDFEMKIFEKVWKIKKAEAPSETSERVAHR